MFEVGDHVDCKWNLNRPDPMGTEEVEDVDSWSYPREGEYFIEVIFMDEVHLPRSEYLALMIVALGFGILLPIVCILIASLGYTSVFQRENIEVLTDVISDFCNAIFIRKKGYIRRNRRRELAKKNLDHFDKVFIWMYTYKNTKDTQFKFSATLAREVTSFISQIDNREEHHELY